MKVQLRLFITVDKTEEILNDILFVYSNIDQRQLKKQILKAGAGKKNPEPVKNGPAPQHCTGMTWKKSVTGTVSQTNVLSFGVYGPVCRYLPDV